MLVIDDDVDAAETLRLALELDGHRIAVAHGGPERIEKARAFEPDVVLCNLALPGVDGYEVARRMRADPELGAACLIALSGYARREDVERSRAAGFEHRIAKPPSPDALNELLARAPVRATG